MRTALALEWIGYPLAPRGRIAFGHAVDLGGKWQVMETRRPWVARIMGRDEHYGFMREFVHGQIDFSQANSVGSRGVMLYFALAPGVYEVNERLSWTRSRRFFVRVSDDAQLTEMTRAEVDAWVARSSAV